MATGNNETGGWPGGWLIATAAGVISALLARIIGEVGMIPAILVGVFVFLVFGVLLGMFWGNPETDDADGHGDPARDDHSGHDHARDDHSGHDHSSGAAAAPAANAGMAASGQMSPTMRSEVMNEPASASLASVPMAGGLVRHDDTSAAAAAEVDVATAEVAPVAVKAADAPVAPVRTRAPAAVKTAKVAKPPAAKSRPVKSATETAPVAAKPEKVAKPAKAAVADLPVVDAAAVAAAGAGKQPKGLKAARGGKADDLQVIEGIGPVLEKLCHSLGIFHFDQIAGWQAAEVAWMDANLKGFRGRVSRDKWMSQARIIGTEGVAAFLERARTNNY